MKFIVMEDGKKKVFYYPMLVSESDPSGYMSPEEDVVVWKKYMTLPQEKKDILTDSQMSVQVMRLRDSFHLSDAFVGVVSSCIRKIFFGELSLEQAEAKIGSMLMTTAGSDPNQAKAITEFIRKEIMTIKPKPQEEEGDEAKEEKSASQMVNMPLLQALSKYDQLANQLITGERIRIKGQPEPVRPSLLNWIKYYRDELGVGYHDNVQRGQFLFRSENGKRLSTEERERINLILRSVEENVPVRIDTVKNEIVFPRSDAAARPKQAVMPEARVEKGPALPNASAQDAPRNSHGNQGGAFASGNLTLVRGTHLGSTPEKKSSDKGSLSFSSPHVFPAEKEAATPASPAKPVGEQTRSTDSGQGSSAQASSTLSTSSGQAPASKPNPFHIRPVSLGKKNGKE